MLALGSVVAALAAGFLGDWVSDLLPDDADVASLLLIAVLATVLANLLTNLSATLLLVPLVAPLGDTAVLAALLGLNIGSGLSYTGSLANLLWRAAWSGSGTAVDARVPPGLAAGDPGHPARRGRGAVTGHLTGFGMRGDGRVDLSHQKGCTGPDRVSA